MRIADDSSTYLISNGYQDYSTIVIAVKRSVVIFPECSPQVFIDGRYLFCIILIFRETFLVSVW